MFGYLFFFVLIIVCDVVVDLFCQFGIDCVFGNFGLIELLMFCDFFDDFCYVFGLYEVVVVGMVDGYVQVIGNVVVVNLYLVVGVGNVMGNLFIVFKNCILLIVIVGQQVCVILLFDLFFGVMQVVELLKLYVKWSIELVWVQDVLVVIVCVYCIVMQELCGFVFVLILVDDWDQLVEWLLWCDVSSIVWFDFDVFVWFGDVFDVVWCLVFVVGVVVDCVGVWDDVVCLVEWYWVCVYVVLMLGCCSFLEDYLLFVGFLFVICEKIVVWFDGYDFVFVFGVFVFIYYIEGFGLYVLLGVMFVQFVDDLGVVVWMLLGDVVVGNLWFVVCDLFV